MEPIPDDWFLECSELGMDSEPACNCSFGDGKGSVMSYSASTGPVIFCMNHLVKFITEKRAYIISSVKNCNNTYDVVLEYKDHGESF